MQPNYLVTNSLWILVNTKEENNHLWVSMMLDEVPDVSHLIPLASYFVAPGAWSQVLLINPSRITLGRRDQRTRGRLRQLLEVDVVDGCPSQAHSSDSREDFSPTLWTLQDVMHGLCNLLCLSIWHPLPVGEPPPPDRVLAALLIKTSLPPVGDDTTGVSEGRDGQRDSMSLGEVLYRHLKRVSFSSVRSSLRMLISEICPSQLSLLGQPPSAVEENIKKQRQARPTNGQP